jgi:hypothetical protein
LRIRQQKYRFNMPSSSERSTLYYLRGSTANELEGFALYTENAVPGGAHRLLQQAP